MYNGQGHIDYQTLIIGSILSLVVLVILWSFLFVMYSRVKRILSRKKQATNGDDPKQADGTDAKKQSLRDAAKKHHGALCDQATERELIRRDQARQRKDLLEDEATESPFV